ncbi:hypothetical protein [Cryptosporangium sp. NPDC048952]|uniref:hypothetical protein n=1 Tax=Cryptosporangium sp. NPDC048952 TaxID=3363961 RepID=UPI00371000E1
MSGTLVTRSKLSRRALLGGSAAIGFSAVLIGNAQPAAATEYQSGWRWCRRCQGLFYGGGINDSRCPTGGRHTAVDSWNYIVPFVDVPGLQRNWRWCRKCQGMFFSGNANTGVCPAGGGHDDYQSFDYRIGRSPVGQPNWRWCQNCQGLFYGDVAASRCPVGGRHSTAGSGNYVLASIS